jgi:PAS domain S-box-containing protein
MNKKRIVLLNLALALVYFVLARMGLEFAYVQEMATLIWMPTGLSLAAVLLGGYRLLPGVALGAFLTPLASPVPLWVCFATSAGNTLEAFLGALFLTRFTDFQISFPRIRDVRNFLLWAALLSTTASATVGVGTLCTAGIVAWEQFPAVWLIWWLGDAVGNMLVAPLILVWSRLPRWQLDNWLEFALVLALTSLVTLAVFGGWIPSPRVEPYPLAFLVFPLLIWGALRFEQYGCTAANFVVAALAAWMTLVGKGPFAAFGLQERIAMLSVFMMLTIVPAQLLAASMSERRHAEKALQQAYDQIHQIIDNAPGVAIQGYDHEGRVLFWNRASERLYGFTEQQALGRRLGEFLLSEEDAREFDQMVQRTLQTGQAASLREWETRTASGTPRYILSSLFPVRLEGGQTWIICMDVDITERKRLESELFRVQRLDSIGRLAGGIAHDFNNLLTAIMSYADLAIARLPEQHPAVDDLKRLLDTANRAADLAKHLLAFARRQTLSPQVIDLNQIIHDIAPLMTRLLGNAVDLRILTEPALQKFKADPAQIQQVILNLAINARDAMPEGGVLTIETANVVLGEADVQSHPDLSPGEYVRLSVRDTGVGMEPEQMEHIFEPFYTTKGKSGTGLGLAVVYGVVKQSGGHITVESKRGQGSTFHIYLPSVPAESDSTASHTTV